MGKLGKLRNVTLDEIRVRGSQALAAFAERRAWSSLVHLGDGEQFLRRFTSRGPKPISPELLLEEFRRQPHLFFPGFIDPDRTSQTLRERWPAVAKTLVTKADSALAGRFDLLGFRELSFGNPIDWHLEPNSGKRAPLLHWSRLNYLDAEVAGDKKVIWELNRHQYFSWLGQAYWLTRDERYAEGFIEHVNAWMEQNPPKLGINWASSLEVSFRSISWLWALAFFRESKALDASFFIRLLKFFYLNARHLETYLSTYFSPNTHLTGEALGLFYLGTFLPSFKESARWRSSGLRILLDQLPRHVKDDGVYFEQSSYYHRYTADFYIHLLIMLRQREEPVPAILEEKLSLLLDHLMHITRPDGTTPLFGDDDGGRLLALDFRAANDFRATLATGAVLFNRSDYRCVAAEAASETLWLTGTEGLATFDQLHAIPPDIQSKDFPSGGYYLMRDGWDRRSNYLLFDCGPHGIDNCGHAHADALSFELAVAGETVLVDPGTYTYTGSTAQRDWFRSSAAHNTLTIDGQSSSEPAGPFSWVNKAECDPKVWIAQERFAYVEGEHNGYQRLPAPAEHRRSLLFLKHDYWVLRDLVRSNGEHQIEIYFHFDSGVDLHEGGGRITARRATSSLLELIPFTKQGSWHREESWISYCYGKKDRSPVAILTIPAKGDDETVVFMLPGSTSQSNVRELPAESGRLFEVVTGSQRDLLAMSTANSSLKYDDHVDMRSDFAWTWMRFSGAEELPQEVVAIDGSQLQLNGHEIINAASRQPWVAATRRGKTYQVATSLSG